jgi:hypothetical protein
MVLHSWQAISDALHAVLLRQVKALLLALQQQNSVKHNATHDTHSSQPAGYKQQQQQQQPHEQQQQAAPAAQSLPWQQLCTLRKTLDLALLPRQLVCGSQYLPSADGVNQNLLLLLHGLGDKPAAFTGESFAQQDTSMSIIYSRRSLSFCTE